MESDYREESVVKRFYQRLQESPHNLVLQYKREGTWESYTGEQVSGALCALVCALRSVKLPRKSTVMMVCDNRPEWLLCDLAFQTLGWVNAPRGIDTPLEDIHYIAEHSESKMAVFENASRFLAYLQLYKTLSFSTVLLMDAEQEVLHSISRLEKEHKCRILLYEDLLQQGEKQLDLAFFEQELNKGKGTDLATLIYTSGTTGHPKGVMLSHQSFLFQLDRIPGKVIRLEEGMTFLSVLPIWHVFERIVNYLCIGSGVTIAYSKPIPSRLLEDMQVIRPHLLACVPRIWGHIHDSVYRKLSKASPVRKSLFHSFVFLGRLYHYWKASYEQRVPEFTSQISQWKVGKKYAGLVGIWLLKPLVLLGRELVFKKMIALFGGRLEYAVAGGSSLPFYLADFYQIIGINLIEGYGMTEAGPILMCQAQKSPMLHTIGRPLEDVEAMIIDPKTGYALEPGKKGELYARSPQLMMGYYKDPQLTQETINKDGFLQTGDLAMKSLTGEFKIVGRLKDTIILSSGENVEPEPLELLLMSSAWVDQVVVLGHNQRYLGALIIPYFPALEEWADSKQLEYMDYKELLEMAEVQELYHTIIKETINNASHRVFEHIIRFTLWHKSFEVGKELSFNMKLKRGYIEQHYSSAIKSLFLP